jgi:hypothetical protein
LHTPTNHRGIPFLARFVNQFAPRLDLLRQFPIFPSQFTVRCHLGLLLRPFW